MDDVDKTAEKMEFLHNSAIERLRIKASEIPKGQAGECSLCENHSLRLVRSVCAPCRDKYKLP